MQKYIISMDNFTKMLIYIHPKHLLVAGFLVAFWWCKRWHVLLSLKYDDMHRSGRELHVGGKCGENKRKEKGKNVDGKWQMLKAGGRWRQKKRGRRRKPGKGKMEVKGAAPSNIKACKALPFIECKHQHSNIHTCTQNGSHSFRKGGQLEG